MVKKMPRAFEPNYAVPPGETLRETIDAMGMNQAELAARTGRPKKTINEIIVGKAAITAETALQLERVLGVPASFWNNLEFNYRETIARLKEDQALAKHAEWTNAFPLKALAKLGWIKAADSPVGWLKELLNFFGVAGVAEWKAVWNKPEAAFRKSSAYQADPFAVSAWLRRGEMEASTSIAKPYNHTLFRGALEGIRTLTGQGPDVFQPRMQTACAEAGVVVRFIPELPGTHIHGAARWLKTNKAFIQLSLRGKSDDHLWFTFFHEAAHILKEERKEVFIDTEVGACDAADSGDRENEANCFAEESLIPPGKYRQFLSSGQFTTDSIKRFARDINVAPGIVVGRLQHEGRVPYATKLNGLKVRYRFTQEGRK
jgi:HTH-type transcriptional regulator / antitoxin HigA